MDWAQVSVSPSHLQLWIPRFRSGSSISLLLQHVRFDTFKPALCWSQQSPTYSEKCGSSQCCALVTIEDQLFTSQLGICLKETAVSFLHLSLSTRATVNIYCICVKGLICTCIDRRILVFYCIQQSVEILFESSYLHHSEVATRNSSLSIVNKVTLYALVILIMDQSWEQPPVGFSINASMVGKPGPSMFLKVWVDYMG